MFSNINSAKNILDQIGPVPSAYVQYLQHPLQIEQGEQEHQINNIPILSRQRVSEKLLENRLRRIQLEYQKEQQKENLLLKRKEREQQIVQCMKRKLETANHQKENNIRESCSQQFTRKRGDDARKKQKLERYQANMKKIEERRHFAEEKKNQYIFRIQKKTNDKLKEVRERRRLIQSMEEQQCKEVHLQEWNKYKGQLIKKMQGKQRRSPDYLYQQFQQKNNWLKNVFDDLVQQVKQKDETKQEENFNKKSSKIIMSSQNSKKSLLTYNKKVEYYGIHEEDMIKKTTKDMLKMRKFIQNNSITVNPLEDEQLLQNFQTFLFQHIL